LVLALEAGRQRLLLVRSGVAGQQDAAAAGLWVQRRPDGWVVAEVVGEGLEHGVVGSADQLTVVGGDAVEGAVAEPDGAIEVVARRWTEPDDGIWEVRGGRRHFVASKVMAWAAVDRAIRLARARGLPADLGRWTALRRTIRRRIEQAGVDPATGAFTQAFDSQALDAANLLLPLVRFLPAEDPRIRVTVERTARELAPTGSSTATWTPTTACWAARSAS
jgi:hypothetical protein